MLSPTLLGRSIIAAFTGDGRGSTTGDRGHAATLAVTAATRSTARGGIPIEVRFCSACAYVPCMYMLHTAY